MCSKHKNGQINLDESRYDQDSYCGRWRQCLKSVNFLNLFAKAETIEEARCLVLKYRCHEPLPTDVTEEDLWKAKHIYDSAYNPETGQFINKIARPSAQLPINIFITAGMLVFYQSTPGVILWQGLKQSYVALINYVSGSGTNSQILSSFAIGSSAAIGTALGLNKFLQNSSPLVRRLVPLAAVCAANCCTIPLMKAQEIKNGVPVFDDCKNKLGFSKRAAEKRVSQNIIQTNALLIPGMVLTPIMLDYLEKRGTLCRYPWIGLPASKAFLGLCFLLVNPLVCAAFERTGHMAYNHLDSDLKDTLDRKYGCNRRPKYVFFNK